MAIDLIRPEWPAPAQVLAVSTTRVGGVSQPPWGTLNLGDHVGDDAGHVEENRRRLIEAAEVPQAPAWLRQVHGTAVADPTSADADAPLCADAAFTRMPGSVCAVMTADCLPVLFCDRNGGAVAAAHAGWRGLAAGVLEQTVARFDAPEDLLAWFGPAIGPAAFEVGDEVREAFVQQQPEYQAAFSFSRAGHWLANIYQLATLRLRRAGVSRFYGGTHCTYTEADRFFSYRRDGITGRMASLVWLRQ